MSTRVDKEFVDEIRLMWRKSGITIKALRKKFNLTAKTLRNIVKNTRQSNDINKNGFRVVRDFSKGRRDDRGGGRGGYQKRTYQGDKKPYYNRGPRTDFKKPAES